MLEVLFSEVYKTRRNGHYCCLGLDVGMSVGD